MLRIEGTDCADRPQLRVRLHPVRSLVVASLVAATQLAVATPACMAKSGVRAIPVVELYTSEGCSSCPPADRWLSTLTADPAVVALAFHVDYWDRLGWKDRFSSARFTERQAQALATDGARFSYTPQVVIDGRDAHDWPSASTLDDRRPTAPVEIALAREGDHVAATVVAGAKAPKRLAAFWAVTEQGHISNVKAGENEGSTLHHYFVVRDYVQIAPWSADDVPRTFGFDLTGKADLAHPRGINLIVLDADTGRPVQALKLGC